MNTLRRSLWISSLTVILVATCAANASAQGNRKGQGGGMGRGFGAISPVTLAANADVQKDLGVKEEAAEKIKALGEEMNTARRELMSGGFPMDQEGRQKLMEDLNKLNKEFGDKLGKLIDEKQTKRLDEIQIQVTGFSGALAMPKVAEALKITDEQQQDIRAAGQDSFAKLRELGQDATAEQRAEVMKEAETAMMKVLTDDQKKAYETLKGKPFEAAAKVQASMRGGMGRGGFGKKKID